MPAQNHHVAVMTDSKEYEKFASADNTNDNMSAEGADVICLESNLRPFADGKCEVDEEGGVVKNIALLSIGPASGHRIGALGKADGVQMNVDAEMLAQANAALAAAKNGVRCRLTHVELRGSAFASPPDDIEYLVGRVKGGRIVDGQLRGDAHIAKYANASPKGRLRDFLLGVSREDPEAIGMSLLYTREADEQSPGKMRIKELRAVDFVGVPGGNPCGLLSKPLNASSLSETGAARSGQGSQQIGAEAPKGDGTMPDDAKKEEKAEVEKVDVEALKKQERDAAVALERKRVGEILALAEAEKVDMGWAKTIALAGKSLDDFRTLVDLAKKNAPVKTDAQVGADLKLEGLSQSMTEAICLRAGGAKVEKPHERTRQFQGLTLVDIYRHWLTALGAKDAFSLSRVAIADLIRPRNLRKRYPEVFALAQSTSDFTNILADAMNKTLQQAYLDAPSTWQIWARRATAPDFKTINRTKLSEVPDLVARTEGNSITYITLSDSKETYALAEYAGGIRLTRKAILNDDLDAFARIPQLEGNAAKRKEDDVAYAILTANAAMADGVALFHANHSNLIAAGGAAPSVTTLAATEKLLEKQKGPKNAARLELAARFLLVPTSLKIVSQQLIGSAVDPAKSNATVNPYSGKLQVVSSARLDDTSTTVWYLAADYNLIDTIEVCFLQDEPAPVLSEETDFDTDDQKYKVRHTVAAQAIDFRGLAKNPGA